MASEKDRMIAGELYLPGDSELVADRKRAQSLMRAYNDTIMGDAARGDLLAALFGSCAADAAVRAPVYVDYGYNIHIEHGVFLNYGCVLLDVCAIRIGAGTQVGPAVQILTADHPRDPETRASGREFGRPITIGRNCWIGGAAILQGADRLVEVAVLAAELLKLHAQHLLGLHRQIAKGIHGQRFPGKDCE